MMRACQQGILRKTRFSTEGAGSDENGESSATGDEGPRIREEMVFFLRDRVFFSGTKAVPRHPFSYAQLDPKRTGPQSEKKWQTGLPSRGLASGERETCGLLACPLRRLGIDSRDQLLNAAPLQYGAILTAAQGHFAHRSV